MSAIYETPTGYVQREFSHAQYVDYITSPARYKWKRIHGWRERKVWATAEMGKDLQAAIVAYYQHRQNPEEVFDRLWKERQSQELHYPKGDSWETLHHAGIQLMRTFLKNASDFPLRDPIFFERGDKDIPSVTDPTTGVKYVSIPDVIEPGQFLADIKCLDRPVPSAHPNIAVLDYQLRTQAATTKLYRVALWVFARTPKITYPSREEIRRAVDGHGEAVAIEVARKALGLTIEGAGKTLGISNPKEKVVQFRRESSKNPELVNIANRISENLSASIREEYTIQWIEGEMTPECAEEALRDELSVVPLIQAGHFPCRCGIRWPNDQALRCPYAGLCLMERTPNAPQEWRDQWEAYTRENLVRWDEQSLRRLDDDDAEVST